MFGLVTRKELQRALAAQEHQSKVETLRETIRATMDGFIAVHAKAAEQDRDQWRELALEALADLRELRKALLPASGVEAVPGVDPKTTREMDAARARALREQDAEQEAGK